MLFRLGSRVLGPIARVERLDALARGLARGMARLTLWANRASPSATLPGVATEWERMFRDSFPASHLTVIGESHAEGEIALGSELVGALFGELPLAKLAPKQLLVVPLPAIRGTLVEPEPEPDWRMLERALLGNVGGVVEGAGELLKGVGKGLLGR